MLIPTYKQTRLASEESGLKLLFTFQVWARLFLEVCIFCVRIFFTYCMNVSHVILDDIKHFQDFSTSETWTLFCLYKLATKNLLLATIFLQLVAKRRPSDFLISSPVISLKTWPAFYNTLWH